MTLPSATYRLQLHAGFTFTDAQDIVPYLADLGISHVYASPITTAAQGSTHGYDVVDPARVDPALGGEDGLIAFVAALRAQGLGLIIDIVPNHMGVAGDGNAWWLDMLANGPASEHAATFDIDWREPLVLPVLGAPLDDVLADGHLCLVMQDGRPALRLYGETTYPLRTDDPPTPEPAQYDPATPAGRAALRALAERQHYRLTYWRAANDSLNWRRFFAINELAGVRVEDSEVFARTHALYIDLFRRGLIDGVRVDHVDGLADPGAYCRRLRQALNAADPGRPAYIVVEKILARGEAMPADWAVDGSSGYDFMREVSALLHDPAGEAPLRALWQDLTGRSGDFAAEALAGRQDMLAWQFEGQLADCTQRFGQLARSAGRGWITDGMLRRAIERLLWVFPVYRTYGTGDHAPAQDAAIRAQARAAIAPFLPPGEAPITDMVLGWLAGEGPGDADLAREAVVRFQQLSAPIAAKGVEDTAFYRHGVLLSANDVGFEPAHMADDIPAFHAAMLRRAESHPAAMIATGTHDHKRGEDARARLAVLSAVPDAWESAARRWMAMAQARVPGLAGADTYMLLQTFVGAWDDGAAGLLPRVQAWQRKALREAKLRSSWEAPDEAYEARYGDLAAALLDLGGAFLEDFTRFMAALQPAADANTIAQAALHCLAPGVPDIYHGAELIDTSMVDPDNRRPVDFALRRALLARAPSKRPAKLQVIADLLALRKANPEVFRGAYRPMPVDGPRSGHVVAFTRAGRDAEWTCVVGVRLGAALFGAPGGVDPQWWGNTRLRIGDETLPVSEILCGGVFHVRPGPLFRAP